MSPRTAHLAACFALALALTGCSGKQSALDPGGRGAERIAELFWWMTGGAVAVFVAVAALTVYAIAARATENEARRAALLIISGGVVVPTVVLASLLTLGLAMLPELVARAPKGSLRIKVTGEQWWWRVRYQLPDGEEVALANEIRLPVGEPVELELDSPDVIHSFWIPALGGKMDMIPGRRTWLALQPARTGTYRGVCAEYCGASHALMAFDVVVMEREELEQWLAEQRRPAREPTEPIAVAGRDHFFADGCSACHTIRGAGAAGLVGPDLTHVGSRVSLGAGLLRNDPGEFARWINHTAALKPSVTMPHFGMLPPEETRALAAYLESLQ